MREEEFDSLPGNVHSELDRLRRLEALDGLLPALTSVLDVRQVFDRLSAIAQKVLPHDALALGLLTDDRRHVRVYAHTAHGMDVPELIPLPDPDMLVSHWDFLIMDDLPDTPEAREKYPVPHAGFRSFLRIPLRVEGELIGGVNFFSFAPGRYGPGDVLVGRRFADHILLAVSHERMAAELKRAAQAEERANALERRVETLTRELEALGGRHRVAGASRSWKEALAQATKVATTPTTVLVTGESGTGKEVVARYIHRASARSRGPFVALNCAAIPETLLESELFGHEKGAFTGAHAARVGRIEQAAGGVLFLDEVGELAPLVQAKLLRFLEEREFQRLGGMRTIRADVRMIAATNRDLRAEIARGTFREDLYYRLAVFEIRLPPLRDRRDDILLLTGVFLEEIGRQLGRPAAGLSRDARETLLGYSWPGNVRELRNVLERASILCDGGLVTREHLSLGPGAARESSVAASPSLAPAEPPREVVRTGLREVERELVVRALEEARYNKTRAARALGLSRFQLYGRLRKLGLS